MEIIESWGPRRLAWITLAGVALLAMIALLIATLNKPPRIGSESEETYKAIDALFTAIQMQDEAKVIQCQERLLNQHRVGRLSREASEYLERIAARARAGEWESAGHSLYDFMLAQRRGQ